MRILLLNQYYLPDTAATGQLLGDVGNALAEQGHEVHVICSRGKYAGGVQPLPRKEKLNGVYVHRVEATAFGRNILSGRLLDYLSFYILAVVKLLGIGKFDRCLALTTPPFIGLLGSIKCHRLILWSMDVYPEIAARYGAISPKGILWRILKKLSNRLYRKAEVIIALGKFMEERLIEIGVDQHKIKVIHNWVPAETVQQEPFPPLPFCMVYAGNLGLGHDLISILEAMCEIPENARPILRIIGSGKAKSILEEFSRKFNLTNVQFSDPVPLEKLNQTLASAHVHVVSQKSGTGGLIVPSKIYGILAAGRPVLLIGPEKCEIAEIIKESQCGYIVPNNNPKKLAELIASLNPDPERGQKARDCYTRNYMRDIALQEMLKALLV